MRRFNLKRTMGVSLCAFLLMQGGLSYADDTEIFLGVGAAQIKPNVFFILDDSVSMEDCWNTEHRYGYPPRWHEDNGKPKHKWSQKWLCPDPDNPLLTKNTNRMKTMKAVMADLLAGMQNVNVGMMTLRATIDNPGDRAAYNQDGTALSEWRSQIVPVKDIDSGSNRNQLINKINSIQSLNLTPIVPSLYEAARYLTAIDGKHDTWELSNSHQDIPSPIKEECQPTHMVLLTDGAANWSWKNIPDGVAPKKSSDQDTVPGSYNSINGPKSYNALPNQLEGQLGNLLDTPVVDLPHLASDTAGKMIFDGKHSDFSNASWAGHGAKNRLCKMRGDWKWIPINEGWGDGGTTTGWLYDEFRYAGDTDCGVELAYWLKNTDQAPKIGGKQSITTHTVGFALNPLGATDSQTVQEFLSDLAKAGGGQAHNANSADELKKALEDIVSQVLQVDSATFINPSVARNSFKTNLEHKDEIYYPLFQPQNSNRWIGNLKRYRLDNSSGFVVIRDAQGNKAFNVNGSFNSNAKSWWSTVVDGADIALGGAAEQLPAPYQRNLFVVLDTMEAGILPALKESNSDITANMLGISASGNAAVNERKQLLRYIRGLDEKDESRRMLGDPLHSAPALFSYGCIGTVSATGQCMGQDDQMLVMGSNEGFIHMFDTSTGVEQFAVMPQPLLKNIKALKANETLIPGKGRPYGMDNTVTIWQDNHKVYAYATMRRGGNGIYALDISNRIQPKLLWKIIGGNAGFERLGQTWSQPVKSKIKLAGTERDVLIFGGGYDEALDNPDYEGVTLGNALYVVDAKSGERLFSVSNQGANLNLAAMTHSITGKVRVVDLDNDDLADQVFFADTGGQVWRLSFNNDKNSGKPALFALDATASNTEGVLALFRENGANGKRRFYHGPDVSFARGKSDGKLHVNIGSGYRAHPLHDAVQDKFYSIQVPRWSGLSDTLREKNLLDVTTRLDGEKIVADIKANANIAGWSIRLMKKGEKVLSTPFSENGEVFFNTYVPGVSSNPCYPALGRNYLYAVDLQSGSSLRGTDRFVESKAMGIAGSPEPIVMPDGRMYIHRDAGSDDDGSGSGSGSGISFEKPLGYEEGKKTYWIDVNSQ